MPDGSLTTPPASERTGISPELRKLGFEGIRYAIELVINEYSRNLWMRAAGIDALTQQESVTDEESRPDWIASLLILTAINGVLGGVATLLIELRLEHAVSKALAEGLKDSLQEVSSQTIESQISELGRHDSMHPRVAFYFAQKVALVNMSHDLKAEFINKTAPGLLKEARRDPTHVFDDLERMWSAAHLDASHAARDQYWESLEAWCVYMAKSKLGTVDPMVTAEREPLGPSGKPIASTNLYTLIRKRPDTPLSEPIAPLVDGVLEVAIGKRSYALSPSRPADPSSYEYYLLPTGKARGLNRALREELTRYRLRDMQLPIRARLSARYGQMLLIGYNEGRTIWTEGDHRAYSVYSGERLTWLEEVALYAGLIQRQELHNLTSARFGDPSGGPTAAAQRYRAIHFAAARWLIEEGIGGQTLDTVIKG